VNSLIRCGTSAAFVASLLVAGPVPAFAIDDAELAPRAVVDVLAGLFDALADKFDHEVSDSQAPPIRLPVPKPLTAD
jgi:hypothetical protein